MVTFSFSRFAKPKPKSATADLAKAQAAEAAAAAELADAVAQSNERARIYHELTKIMLYPERSPFAHLRGVDFSSLAEPGDPIVKAIAAGKSSVVASQIIAAGRRARGELPAPPVEPPAQPAPVELSESQRAETARAIVRAGQVRRGEKP